MWYESTISLYNVVKPLHAFLCFFRDTFKTPNVAIKEYLALFHTVSTLFRRSRSSAATVVQYGWRSKRCHVLPVRTLVCTSALCSSSFDFHHSRSSEHCRYQLPPQSAAESISSMAALNSSQLRLPSRFESARSSKAVRRSGAWERDTVDPQCFTTR